MGSGPKHFAPGQIQRLVPGCSGLCSVRLGSGRWREVYPCVGGAALAMKMRAFCRTGSSLHLLGVAVTPLLGHRRPVLQLVPVDVLGLQRSSGVPVVPDAGDGGLCRPAGEPGDERGVSDCPVAVPEVGGE